MSLQNLKFYLHLKASYFKSEAALHYIHFKE